MFGQIYEGNYMYNRYITNQLKSSLESCRITLLTGPLRSGKTTLIKQIIDPSMEYLTLEDPKTRAFAKCDPSGFVKNLDRAVIDEIQRAPEIYSSLKMSVDFDQRYGRFLLAGSTDIRLMLGLANFMVGRMFSHELLPLSATEFNGHNPTFIEKLTERKFCDQEKVPNAILGNNLKKLLLKSGYPELAEKGVEDTNKWYECYLEEVLSRVLMNLGFVRKIECFVKLIQLLTEEVGKPLNYEKLVEEINVSIRTLHRYLIILKSLYLVDFHLPFYPGVRGKYSKTAKVFYLDSSMLASCASISYNTLYSNPEKFQLLLKNFVSSEISKQGAMQNELWNYQYHFSDDQNHTVDIIYGSIGLDVTGINISTKTELEPEDFRSLEHLANLYGSRFLSGVILYDGDTVYQHQRRFFAIPISSLWS